MLLTRSKKRLISLILSVIFFMFALASLPIIFVQASSTNYTIPNPFADTERTQDDNTCWAYAGTLMIETFYYNHISQTAKRLSPRWFALAYDHINTDYHYGGTGIVSDLSEIIVEEGCVAESDFLTNEYTNQQIKDNPEAVYNNLKPKASTTLIRSVDINKINVYVSNDCGLTYTYENLISSMKIYLEKNGAIATALENSKIEQNGETKCYVNPGVKSSDLRIGGHAVSIIGYDDTYVVTKGENIYTGAFICLNSQGSTNKYINIPYEMYKPNADGNESAIAANTFYISSLNGVIADTQNSSLSFLNNLKATLIIGTIVFMVLIAIVIITVSVVRHINTASINRRVSMQHLLDYERQKQFIEHRKKEINEEIEAIRERRNKRKQRHFQKENERINKLRDETDFTITNDKQGDNIDNKDNIEE